MVEGENTRLKLVDSNSQYESFFYQLYLSTRKEEFALLGWGDNELELLLRMQYEAQKSSYQQQFPLANYQVVLYGDVAIGRLVTERQESAIRLIDISLLPEYRGKEVGTELLNKLQALAANQKISLTLHVLRGNPAQRLYERCGFYVAGVVEPYVAMKWDS